MTLNVFNDQQSTDSINDVASPEIVVRVTALSLILLYTFSFYNLKLVKIH